MATSVVLNFGIASFLVVVAGGNPLSLNTWAFASLLSSVCFFESFKDAQLISEYPLFGRLYLLISSFFSLYHLRISSLASSASCTWLLATLGSLIGSLLTGLIVILDWDATWQKFPIPNAIGCIFGELCGTLIGMMLLKRYTKTT